MSEYKNLKKSELLEIIECLQKDKDYLIKALNKVEKENVKLKKKLLIFSEKSAKKC